MQMKENGLKLWKGVEEMEEKEEERKREGVKKGRKEKMESRGKVQRWGVVVWGGRAGGKGKREEMRRSTDGEKGKGGIEGARE